MSDSSRKDSTGYSGLFGRMKSQIGNSRGIVAGRVDLGGMNIAKMFRKAPEDKEEVVPQIVGRDLGQYGYQRFNVSEGCNIYINNQSNSAIFNDTEPVFAEGFGPTQADDLETPVMDVPEETIEEVFESVTDVPEEVQTVVDIPEEEFVAFEAEPIESFDASAEEDIWKEVPEEDGSETIDIRYIESDAEPEVETSEETDDDLSDSEGSKISCTVSVDDLFGNVKRGSNGFVDTDIGVFADGEVKKVEAEYKETRISAKGIFYGSIDDYVKEMESASEEPEEIMRIGSSEEISEDDVPEVFVPKVEDFTEEEAAAEVEDVIPMLPASVPVPAISAPVSIAAIAAPEPVMALAAPVVMPAPVWEVDEATASAFVSYHSIIPDYYAYTVTAESVWDVTEDAVEAFSAFNAIEPEYPATVAVIPAWDVTEGAIEAFSAYMTIEPEYPSVVAEIPAWDICEEGADAFSAFVSIEPEYPEAITEVYAWDVTDEATDAFVAFGTIRPEYPTIQYEIPAWDVADETAESFTAFAAAVPDFPKAEVVSVFDVTDDSAESFTGFMSLCDGHLAEAFMAELPRTISVAPLEPQHEEVDMTAYVPQALAHAETSSADAGVKVDMRNDPTVDRSNLEIRPEVDDSRKLRQSRYVFKNGRLQKVVSEPVEVAVIEETILEKDAVVEQCTTTVAAEPDAKPRSAKLVAKEIEGVTFSFGQSGGNGGSVRFMF